MIAERDEENFFVALEMVRAAKRIAANSPEEVCLAIKKLLEEAERHLVKLEKSE